MAVKDAPSTFEFLQRRGDPDRAATDRAGNGRIVQGPGTATDGASASLCAAISRNRCNAYIVRGVPLRREHLQQIWWSRTRVAE